MEDSGDSFANVGFRFEVLNPLNTSEFIGSGKILSPFNVPIFIPSHCLNLFGRGQCTAGLFSAEDRLRSGAALRANYATSPGLAGPPSATNEFATMDVFLYFLGTTAEFVLVLLISIRGLEFFCWNAKIQVIAFRLAKQ